MSEVEIGRGKRGRTAYSFDDIAIVPSRRTRDPEEVSVAWQIDAYRFEMPVLAAPMDSVVSPATAIAIGELGGLGVLNLEGLWTRYDETKPQMWTVPLRDEVVPDLKIESLMCTRQSFVKSRAPLEDNAPGLKVVIPFRR